MRQATHRTARFRASALAALVLSAGLALAAPAGAAEQEYRPEKAGHPLRIVAYVLHPVGVILDTLIFRPAWWLGGKEPVRTLVGRERPSED